jgi:agmatinase
MQQSAAAYLRHGQTPFFRLSDSLDIANADVALIGVPHDMGCTYRPGARFAPFDVRRVSAMVDGYHPVHEVDVFAQLRCVDAGNIVFPPFDREAMRGAIEAEVRQLAAARVVPLVIGGDHSISLPILRALAKANGPLAVVHFDAHLDLTGPDVWGDAYHHGTPIRHTIEEGLVEQGQLYQVGLRGPRRSKADDSIARAQGHRSFTADHVAEHGARRVAAEIRERIERRPVYITFDVDAIDPAFAPGTGTPVPGGLSPREAFTILRGLAGLDICGADVVEVCPALDHADITCHLAAHLLFEELALIATCEQGGQR